MHLKWDASSFSRERNLRFPPFQCNVIRFKLIHWPPFHSGTVNLICFIDFNTWECQQRFIHSEKLTQNGSPSRFYYTNSVDSNRLQIQPLTFISLWCSHLQLFHRFTHMKKSSNEKNFNLSKNFFLIFKNLFLKKIFRIFSNFFAEIFKISNFYGF